METLESKSDEFMYDILRALTTYAPWKAYDIDPSSMTRVPPIKSHSTDDSLGGVEFRLVSIPGHSVCLTHDRERFCQLFIRAQPGATSGVGVGITRRAVGSLSLSTLPKVLVRLIDGILAEEREVVKLRERYTIGNQKI